MTGKSELDGFIKSRNFKKLFIELGWDLEVSGPPIFLQYGESVLETKRVAEKHGFVVCVCDAGKDYPVAKTDRRRLVNQLAKHHYEHLLILLGEGKQCWTLAIRPQNRPMRTVEVEWRENQDVQFLVEKLNGIFFDISEEEGIRLTDVVDRVRGAFMKNSENVTKKFYGEFQKKLSEFSDFIQGIQSNVSKEWYAALMLNRLMFIYFIQKKGFLDGDANYLENRLRQTQEQFGKDEFDKRFYRYFLRRLFSEGLGTPEGKRAPELRDLLGKVPYLNGGLFDVHEIEKENRDIEIPDEAFEKLFSFFGQYNWHLDTRAIATGRDINPDVIGYIFEKYINDRAAMGAYYTQEDITGYISRNTIIPFLLNRAKEKCKNAFDPRNGIWRFLRENPDNYIYDAVKKGCDIPDGEIPENIRRGIDTKAPNLIERRKDWNTKTEERFSLPTEIWRETIARRQRYFELKRKIEDGEVCEIDDLITYNLDIERFASDALRHYEGSDFIAAFYEAIAGRKALKSNEKTTRGITVLDPACGSGAFLFAALNILEPLYRACIERMEDFVDEDEKLREQGERKGTKKHPQFRVVLEEIETHQNWSYWIYKTIILNNLYGVDIMREAAEIAKLRLFLKLAAEAEYDPDKDNFGLEPLPDIDFNIRSGNSLVGFASMEQFEKVVAIDPRTNQRRIDLDDNLIQEIHEQARIVQKANEAFRQAQDSGGDSYRRAKDELNTRLNDLSQKMNHYLAEQYSKQKEEDYRQWVESHQPFHWMAEFYGIVEEDGGFDVVIGNPPYVEYSKVRNYTIEGYQTKKCGNLYAFFMELAQSLIKNQSYLGMIVPISIMSAKRMESLRSIYNSCKIYTSNFADRPSSLFLGVHQMVTILLATNKNSGQQFSCKFRHWNKVERDILFFSLSYIETTSQNKGNWLKADVSTEQSIFFKINEHKVSLASYFLNHGELMSVCGGTGGYWLRAFY